MTTRRFDPRVAGALAAAAAAVCLCASAAAQHHGTQDERALRADPRTATGPIAPLLEGLGDLHHPVTTRSDRAQAFFDQGLRLAYGFNHQEALRSFKEAARLDPECAMAYWGWAYVLGPNLNLPMQPEAVPQAREAIRMALERREGASAKERDYIDALAARYVDDPQADRAPLDAAYAAAMRRVHEKYPDDPDAATLYAEALMDQSPWDYWTPDGRPRERTPEILTTLESVMKRDPTHIGALHFYIHTVEPVDPERGVAAADRLRGLAPGAGHLVHMPSHIFMRVGRYAEAYASNALAVQADEGYITQCRAQGIYPLAYYPHNLHFLAWGAMMQGRGAAAIDAARKVASKVPQDYEGDAWGLYQSFLSMPLSVMVRFGRWDEILREPEPPARARYWAGMWRFARGMAYTRSGRLKKGRAEAAALDEIREQALASSDPVGFSNAATMLDIASELLSGELSAAAKSYDEAVGHLDRAVRLEDSLRYNEPPDWILPVRHALGAVLLEAGRPAEAEVVYWQDLRKNQENGFALFGLEKSLAAQGRDEEAREIAARFRAAWAAADVRLAASRF